jgi:cysteine desulfurase
MKRIYADHNATSPLFGALAVQAHELVGQSFANPSSAHGPGRHARELVETARARVAKLASALPEKVVFTGSATEANFLAIEGHLKGSHKKKLVVSAIEHPSVLENAKRLRDLGVDVVTVAVSAEGVLDLDALDAALPGACVCALMWANNETGVVQPVAEAASLCREHGVRFHVDAVQGAGKLDGRIEEADTLTLSGHKLGSLPGIGALVTKGERPQPVMWGGGQQGGLRGGTEPVLQAALFGEAAALWSNNGAAYRVSMRAARDAFESALASWVINGKNVERLPNTSNVRVDGVRGEALLSALDLDGVAVSHGAACATGALEPSHVLLAMGVSHDDARRCIRVSFGPESSAEEGAEVARRVLACTARLRAQSL